MASNMAVPTCKRAQIAANSEEVGGSCLSLLATSTLDSSTWWMFFAVSRKTEGSRKMGHLRFINRFINPGLQLPLGSQSQPNSTIPRSSAACQGLVLGSCTALLAMQPVPWKSTWLPCSRLHKALGASEECLLSGILVCVGVCVCGACLGVPVRKECKGTKKSPPILGVPIPIYMGLKLRSLTGLSCDRGLSMHHEFQMI